MRSSRMFQLSDARLDSTVRVEALRLWRDDTGSVTGRFSVTIHSGIALSCRFELDTPVPAAARFAERALEWLASEVPPTDDADHAGRPAPDDERRVVAELAPGRSTPQLRLHPYHGVTANVGDAALTVAEILEPERDRSAELLRAFRRYLDHADEMVEPEPAFEPLRLRSGDGGDEVRITPTGMPGDGDAEVPCMISVRTAGGVSGSFRTVVSVFSVLDDFVLPALAGLDAPGRRTADGGPYWYPFEYSRATSLYLRLEADHWIVSVSPGLRQGAEELELTLRDPDVAGLRAGLLAWRGTLAGRD